MTKGIASGGAAMGRLIEEPAFRNQRHLFKGREEAGENLAERLMKYRHTDSLVLAIPSGGVPVGLIIAPPDKSSF
jgi:putative phosphoribosyl transferase